jgi:long-chain acyl-CoA synthetase
MYNNENTGELIQMPGVNKVFSEEINKINKTLSDSEKILRFRLVSDEWSPVSGELSASLKLKRQVIETKYSELIEKIYRKN